MSRTSFRSASFCLALALVISAAGCQPSRLTVGGVPGIFVGGRTLDSRAQPASASIPDAAMPPEMPVSRGQVKFSMPLEKQPEKKYPEKKYPEKKYPEKKYPEKKYPEKATTKSKTSKPSRDPVKAAIERSFNDRYRSERIRRTVLD